MHAATLLSGGSTLGLQLFGEIGEHFLFGNGIGPNWLADKLKQNPMVSTIAIQLSSPGGHVWDGMAMRSMLAAHPARVEIDVMGLAASAGSVLCTAADVVRMHAGAVYMVHTARGHSSGDAAEHRRNAGKLEAISDQAAELYARRAGRGHTKQELLELMNLETWFTPEQSVAFGLADEVVRGKTAPVMHFDLGKYGYGRVPPEVMSLCTSAYLMLESPPPLPAADDEDEDEPDDSDDDEDTLDDDGTTDDGANHARVDTLERIADMSLIAIALALGAPSNADEPTLLQAVERMKQHSTRSNTLFAELRTITKMQSDEEVLGAVRGMAEAAAQVPKLLADAKTHADALDAQKRVTLLAADKADPKGRKLTPALEQHYASRSVSELEAFLQVAPHVLSVDGKPVAQPKTGSGAADGGGGSDTGGGGELLKHNGKVWKDLKPQERHELFVDDKNQYDAMRAQHEQR